MNALRIYTECHYAECHSTLVTPENITKEFSNTNALAYFTWASVENKNKNKNKNKK